MPRQEPGVRPARPLGYCFDLRTRVDKGMLDGVITNHGTPGVQVQLRGTELSAGPYSYTVGTRYRLEISVLVDTSHDVASHGPNGFHRRLAAITVGVPQTTL